MLIKIVHCNNFAYIERYFIEIAIQTLPFFSVMYFQ